MKLNNKSLCKHIVTALSLGGISVVHASSVDNVDTNIGTPQSGDDHLINNARILNGEPAKREDFPYIGRMSGVIGSAYRECGISLISDRIAVTAASCILNQSSKSIQYVNYISITINSRISKNSPSSYHSSNVVHIHPEFSPKSLENDIVILELMPPVSKDIATPVAIYSGNVTDSMDLITAGWGSTPTGISGVPSDMLNTAMQSPSSSSICKDANAIWSDNNKNLVCTLVKNGKSLASGDGGNPLAYMNNGVNLLVGIASNTGRSGGGATINPENTVTNYYTHVYSYIDWIVNVTGLEKSYLLNTTARPSPDYSTITDTFSSAYFYPPISASNILQSTGFTLVMLLVSILALLI